MRFEINALYPFDLGLELDFKESAAGKGSSAVNEFFKSISTRVSTVPVLIPGIKNVRAEPSIETTSVIYKFGVGILGIKISVDCSIKELAEISFLVEDIRLGKTTLVDYARSAAESIIKKATRYATYRYETRLPEEEIFPIFTTNDVIPSIGGSGGASRFIEENSRVIFGILSGEKDYEKISDYILSEEKLINYGYYQNDIILIKRFGAFVRSEVDAAAVSDMIKLALSQYWSLKSYNYIMDQELDKAQTLISRMPPYYKFWKMPGAYHKFSSETIDFDKDKIAIVDSLYNVMVNIPRLEADWHLKTIHRNVNKVFGIDELYKTVGMKIERIEESYNAARDYMATNFFILLDLIFFLSLAWSVFDTMLLYTIARK